MALPPPSPQPAPRTWALVALVGLGCLGAATRFHPVTGAALALTSLAVAFAVMCTPPGEQLLRARGARAWSARVAGTAAALVAAAGVAATGGASVLLLWGFCLAGAWLFLDRPPAPLEPLAAPAARRPGAVPWT